jgi:hypothetical protein
MPIEIIRLQKDLYYILSLHKDIFQNTFLAHLI